MQIERPFSQASENNKKAILTILKSAFAPSTCVLEIGSGTGQHAEYFAQNLPWLQWQPTDQCDTKTQLQAWLQEYTGSNMLPARDLDVCLDQWPSQFDAVFSANTAHIMPWSAAEKMVQEVAIRLTEGGMFALYGPFNYNGEFTSSSNAQFDMWLKERASHQGIRDFEHVASVAESHGLMLVHDHAMPANNRLIVWKKRSQEHVIP